MTRLAWLLLLAACAHGNEAVVRELEARAKAAPRPELDALLRRPDGAVAGDLREVRLRMLPGAVPRVAGAVNGAPATLLLDTGASHVFFSGAVARRSGLYVPPAEAETVVTPGESSPYRPCVFEELRMGPLRFGPGVGALALREAPDPHDCVVGGSILSRFRVTFDFRRREVRLSPHAGDGEALTLFTEVRVDGRPLWLMVDSGASRVVLEPWAAQELGLLDAAEAGRLAKREGAAGAGPRVRLRLHEVTVAGRPFRDVKGLVVDTFGGAVAHGIRPAGLLGLAAFGPRSWTLDYGTRSLTVED